jgi:betaine-aldehyde dehydrogenase
VQTSLLIGSELVEGEGAPLEVVNPADESVIATVGSADHEQTAAAAGAAMEAAPLWADTPAAERAELLHGFATGLRERTEELAELMTREGGKPLLENRDEVGWTASAFDFYAELARAEAGRVIPPVESSQLAMVLKEPLGVVACIVPWNYPLLLLAWKLAPVLAAGNTAVCKPSELTPLSTLALADLVAAHFPAGVVNLLAGAGGVGAQLVGDPRIDGIAFTGSVATGTKIAERAASRLARVNLELGGKDAFIVCADVGEDIEIAARGAAWAAFLNAGQVCTSAERLYVEAPVYDAFLEALVEHTRSLVIGDPMDPDTDVGPMISGEQRAKVRAQLDAAVAEGAEVLVGGHHAAFERGFYLAPAVVTGAAGATELLREETFGPVAPVVKVDSLDEAILHANATRYGLGANVYTRSLENAIRCAKEIRAGTVWINDPLTDNDAGPFGGMKSSGMGRELGREGLEAFQETKHVHIETRLEIKDWWFPYGD